MSDLQMLIDGRLLSATGHYFRHVRKGTWHSTEAPGWLDVGDLPRKPHLRQAEWKKVQRVVAAPAEPKGLDGACETVMLKCR